MPTLIDGVRPEAVARASVLVEEGRIRDVFGPADVVRVDDAEVIDLDGQTRMPGLRDVHVHPDLLSVDEVPFAEQVTWFGHRLIEGPTESGR